MQQPWYPPRQGLYEPALEHDACGFACVAQLSGQRSQALVRQGLLALIHLTHRGGVGADPSTGDGAGILIQLSDAFFRAQALQLGFDLGEPGSYAVGMGFFAPEKKARQAQFQALQSALGAFGHVPLGFRAVPIAPEVCGPLARQSLPAIYQLFVQAKDNTPQEVFERHLYLARRAAAQALSSQKLPGFHLASLSTRTIVYKGLLLPQQIEPFYPDLTDPRMETAFALVHQRYSTNTFPAWSLAQPFRYLAHNGEINTLRGNVAWMRARQTRLVAPLFGEHLPSLFPILTPGTSDSAQLDNALELLVQSGRPIAQALSMLIPPAWESDPLLPEALRAYYEYHSLLTEPWDGPAALTFTDGKSIGALLDRNGLRPARYTLTREGLFLIASETGVLQTPPAQVKEAGRLGPGQMVLADLERGRLLHDEEIKESFAQSRDWPGWVSKSRIALSHLPEAPPAPALPPLSILRLQQLFGYSLEDLRLILPPMACGGYEAVGSMGDDTALACLSERPRLLYHYFKQLFAQVTNPPIDSLRERLVMSLSCWLGPAGNLLTEEPLPRPRLLVPSPILDSPSLEKLRHCDEKGLISLTLDALYPVAEGEPGLDAAIRALCEKASKALEQNVSLLIVTDRGVSPDLAPISPLLITAALHHYLVQSGQRLQCSLIIDTAEAWEVAHFALLLGYGADVIHPYLAYRSVEQILRDGSCGDKVPEPELALENYQHAVEQGLLKIMAKMGISTLQSYRGAQVFEAVGLSRSLVDRFFPGTPSRISGIDLQIIAQETAQRHHQAFAYDAKARPELDPGGLYQWRRRGEKHSFHPDAIARLQHAVRMDSFATFQEFSRAANEQSERLCTLRALLEPKALGPAIPLSEVEPVQSIVKRFCTGAMSFGSISKEAHETLALAMNQLGGKSNTGEGGEDPARFIPDPESGQSKRSAIKQVASGRFGVTSHYLVNADELQIKIAQGAKPGEGGQLPGYKVDETIAWLRHSTPGIELISPPPHHDIYSIEDLAQLIYDLRCANPRAQISVKLVSETGVGTIAAGVAKGGADGVLIAGHDGGTGASPLTSIKWAGTPWEIGLAETQQTLVLNQLRARVRLQVDGGLKTGRDVVIAALLGADEFGFSSAPLVALGCIMMRVCHLNTCPVGIATQDPELRKRFAGTAEHVVRYFLFVAQEVREAMSQLGFRRFDEMIGRADCLQVRIPEELKKAHNVDFSELLYRPPSPSPLHFIQAPAPPEPSPLDQELFEKARRALEKKEPVVIEACVRNVHRTIGARLGAEVSRLYGLQGLPEGTLELRLRGTAGQSLGAFLPRGITVHLEGDANDYVAKGLSGGTVVVQTPKNVEFCPHDNVLVGNVCLYGATSGRVFINGRAGERFAVRNSGALAVVEGLGDHGCEYMTGGVVLVLGSVGRNFAAGMSGGVAYVLDEKEEFARKCNRQKVELGPLEPQEQKVVHALLEEHASLTQSPKARQILQDWELKKLAFVQVIPLEYKRLLQQKAPQSP